MLNCEQLAFAHGLPISTGKIKCYPEDFKVNELLGFDLTGEGEHLFLQIEKKGLNTEEVVKLLAQALHKSIKAISYAGLKDKEAVTTQWFSIHCPGETIDSAHALKGEGWRVIQEQRHAKKLRTGALAANEFTLVIRELSHPETIEARLNTISTVGVPNYFGPQRFGYENQNLLKAERLLLGGMKVKNHFLRGIYYSAARAFLFNQILNERVKSQTWNKAISGDVMQLSGSHSIFSIEETDDVIDKRVTEFDISPAAPLWGKGDERLQLQALAHQQNALASYEAWCAALEQQGLERAYRALRLIPENMKWEWQGNILHVSFRLTPGSYATAVMRELFQMM
ncbi:tRNA pseudouridine(13) synthase TruD [Legionella hackeliae]|uniref:tRNA pseudouridine synthase D n=1 Tax=Legionella hackeliae TaxID=449 RepID=A0A0A8UQL9_LEGHA|nr:tRNA pseudouridine(13) synthase TruD [Legionella hackeliae]KTD09568.1 hydrogenase [Legionella hackeliae]CEK11115.1 tRNA pseudouridine synthase D [Legionella hackeliae]STX47867.1 hydrogenase [Legionella hackeliae]